MLDTENMYREYLIYLLLNVDWYPWSLDWHLDQDSMHTINIRSNLDQHLEGQFVNSLLIFADTPSSVNLVSTKYRLRCWSSVNQGVKWVLISGRLRALIGTRPQMSLVHMIQVKSVEPTRNHFLDGLNMGRKLIL